MGAARVLGMKEIDDELKPFYGHVKVLCTLVKSYREHISEVAYGVDADLIHRTLDHLESTIAPEILDSPIYEAFPLVPRHGKLHAFNRQWEKIKEQSDNDAALQYISSFIKFGTNAEERDQLIQLLEGCAKELQIQKLEDQSDWVPKELSTTNASVGSSSLAVWNAVQSIFKAFVACSNCECIPTHKSRARLRLGTYRKNNIRREEDMDECLDFDIFLSVKQGWTEAHVSMAKEIKEKAVQIQNTIPIEQHKEQKKATKIKQMRVKQLCELIEKLKTAGFRLKLKVMGDQIFKLKSEKMAFFGDRAKSPVTLEQFLRNGPDSLTDRTKRILAVMLSYAVLYLHDTPWLQSTWSSSHVLFLPTASSTIPLQPFIQTHLARHNESSQDSCTDPDDVDPDCYHHCPLLVTLAVILMELYFGNPFDVLAKRYLPQLDGDTQSSISTRSDLFVDGVFQACKAELSEGYHYAVEKCLDSITWEDEDGDKLDGEALMWKIYQEVIMPLETELSQSFSKISSEDLDEFAKDINIANWDQYIQPQAQVETPEDRMQDGEQTRHRKRPRFMSPVESPRSSASDFIGQFLETHQYGRHSNGAPRSPYDTSQATMIIDEYQASQFFDGETTSEAHTDEACLKYRKWRDRYLKVYEKFIPDQLDLPGIKIAILDTGIDIQHPYIDARLGNIMDRYDWLNDDETANVRLVSDLSGHGTFAASLILDYAPDAQLFVARIAEKERIDEKETLKASVIAKAINYAVSTWGVDIISMSFGFRTREIDGYHEIQEAITNAHAKHVLLFAAASNSGGSLGRTYPARDQNVIAIHATDTDGNRSRFSPTPLKHDINLATVGEAIESAWPAYLPGNSNSKFLRCKSGTSFATPIAAGIAAFLLLYAKIYLPDKADALKSRQKMQELLMRMAVKEPGQTDRDGYCFIDLSLYPESLFGESKEFITAEIRHILSA
ncbi:Peptidase_S8 domain-containing protein [Trichoderma simmonsii]|uniref:Peptidase_S8 domain-containing protein n=1 Tax=Trichoderma simmonsii TaxID=1491479 RepID=A0A8G0LAE0_9HYPO|nr:Peptidase_S8 domain-containing protein [Trichoderma simmonsii]